MYTRLKVGTCLAGDCDEIADVARVSTRFFHIANFPLLPLGTVLVVGKELDDGSYRAIEMRFSLKSCMLAYARALLAAAWFASALWGLSKIVFRDYWDPPWFASAAKMVGVWGFLGAVAWLTYRLGRSSAKRTSELEQILAAATPADTDEHRLSARSW